MDDVSASVRAAVAWLDAAKGRDEAQLTIQILKIVEEAGEAAAAWIGATGTNPRKDRRRRRPHRFGRVTRRARSEE